MFDSEVRLKMGLKGYLPRVKIRSAGSKKRKDHRQATRGEARNGGSMFGALRGKISSFEERDRLEEEE
jgi:hypothetical protein